MLETANTLLSDVGILDLKTVVTDDLKRQILMNGDVVVWLGKVGYSTRPHYLTSLCYFLKCVDLQNPSALLDLKCQEDIKRRLFPAERLVEVWQTLAAQQGLSPSRIKKTLDAIRSFFKHNRIPLIQVTCTYKPKAKKDLSDEDLRKFREGFNWFGKVLFDFLLSVPIRDGQFQKCPNCGVEFYPRWSNITTFPVIEAYSPFMIKPQKGHESNGYPEGLMQVCFLTETAAKSLRMLKEIKEKALARALGPDEYIFTHQKSHRGERHIAPTTKGDVTFFFQEAEQRTGVKLSPHVLRSYVNSVLASRGIDKQLRDLYLGHTCAYEMGYIMQLLPKWRQAFHEARAMEHLDIVAGSLTASDIEDKLLQIQDQQREISRLKEEVRSLETLRSLVKKGKVEIKGRGPEFLKLTEALGV
jgi:hypothetical protein